MTVRPNFFVVGTGRSGTTLVRAILTGHPRLAIPGETGFLPKLLRVHRLWWRRNSLDVNLFLRLSLANGRLERAGLDRETLREALQSNTFDSAVDVVSLVYELLGEGAEIVGDKTPGYIRHLTLLTQWFPDAAVIRMTRHPLDVVSSLRTQPWGPTDVGAAAIQWKLDQDRYASFLSGFTGCEITVRLEDLVARPEASVSLVSNVLGIDVVPAMFDHVERAGRIAGENIHPESHQGLNSSLVRTRSWRDELSEAEAAVAWSIVGGRAGELGYSGPENVAEAGPLRVARARAWLEADTLRRLGNRMRTLYQFVRD